MKKWMVSLALVLLLAMSVLVIFEEAFARPMLCDTMEYQCQMCGGSWHIDWCESWDQNGNGYLDCEFHCYDITGGPFCYWPVGMVWGYCAM